MLVKSLVKGLKLLTAEAEKMEKIVTGLENQQTAKPKAKVKPKSSRKRAATKRPTKTTDQDKVLEVIKRSKKGVTTAQIKQKTGFGDRKIWSVINRLKRQGTVKSTGRGVYEKV
jgi:predicted HTH transcriptional regulator